MIFYPLAPDQNEQCGYQEWRDGGLKCCGKPAVVGCTVPLCKEHADYAVSMTKSSLHDGRGRKYPISAKEFWGLVELNSRERAKLNENKDALKRSRL